MSDFSRFLVAGTQRGRLVKFVVEARTEAAARGEAELQGIVVTSIGSADISPAEPAGLQRATPPAPVGSPPSLPGAAAPNLPRRAPKAQPERRLFIPHALGWVFLGLALLVVAVRIAAPGFRRHPTIDAMLAGDDPEGVGHGVGFLVGSNVVVILAFALGSWAYVGTGRRRARVLLVASVLAAVANTASLFRPSSTSLSGSRFSTTTEAQRRRATLDMAKAITPAAPGEVPTLPEGSASPEAHGEMAYLVRTTQDMMAGFISDAREYQGAVISMGLDSVFLPTRLDSDAEVTESQARVAGAMRQLDMYRQAVRTRVQVARDAFEHAPYAPAVRDELLRGFRIGLALTEPDLERVLRYERAVYDETAVLLEFMLSVQGKFEVVDGALVFESDEDVNTYNASIARIRSITVRQAELQQEMQDRSRDVAGGMRRDPTNGGSLELSRRPLSPSRNITIAVNGDGLSIDGQRVALPAPLDSLSEHLGEPGRRVEEEGGVVHLWDALGIAAFVRDGGQVWSVEVAINTYDKAEAYPQEVFGGTLSLGGVVVQDIDTPRSLNRSLIGCAFVPLDPAATAWVLEFPNVVLFMTLADRGSDWVLIEAPDSAPGASGGNPGGKRPRF